MIPIPALRLNAIAVKLIAGICCALLLALLIHDRNRWKAKTTHYAELLAGERAAHAGTEANYRAAAERARRQDAENAARVKAEQEEINERSRNEFENRIAAARFAAERLRRETAAAAADPGVRRAAPVSRLPAAAGGTAQAAGKDGLSQSGQRAASNGGGLAPEDALIATEQAIQLDELIRWVRLQAEVRVNRGAD